MADPFWRLKLPMSKKRLARARDVLERHRDAGDWLDVLAALDDGELVEFLAPLTGRSSKAVKKRLVGGRGLAGSLKVIGELGRHKEELLAIWQ